MLRKVAITLAIALLTLFAVGGQYRYEGEVLFTLSRTHGVHAGDVPLVVVALVVVALVWSL